ncbi:DUF5999 family protein [Streptomyces sp. NPDC008313]|uniref:DUF5999 family protein n=1 Tax=Streptomyces sp. NPDC008313 TaxID=3364826 RepID=UPI0036E5F11B
MCSHQSPGQSTGQSPDRSGREAAHEAVIVAAHPEQGWSLRCDGVIVFDDTGELLPDGSVVAPHRVVAGRGPDGRTCADRAAAGRLAVAA